MNERALEYEVGNLIFYWRITLDYIQVYEAKSHFMIAKLGIMKPDDGQIVPFERDDFEKHCDWFIEQGTPEKRRVEIVTGPHDDERHVL